MTREIKYANLYKDQDGYFISDSLYDSHKSAYENRDQLSTYVDTVALVSNLPELLKQTAADALDYGYGLGRSGANTRKAQKPKEHYLKQLES